MRDAADSWTYCVVVSNDYPGGGGTRTFNDFVTHEQSYVHPCGRGSGWTKTPPNFLAFRWGNQERLDAGGSARVFGALRQPPNSSVWTEAVAGTRRPLTRA
jgi:hypothetical protein